MLNLGLGRLPRRGFFLFGLVPILINCPVNLRGRVRSTEIGNLYYAPVAFN